MALADMLKNYGGSVSAAARYLSVFVAGAGVAAGLTGLSPADVQSLAEQLKTLGDGIATILTTLGTVVAILTAWYGAWKASRPQQALTVTKDGSAQLQVSRDATPAMQALALSSEAKHVVPRPGVQP